MSNLESFLTGFFNKSTEINDENRQRADAYYDRQLERAQTIGVERIQARRAKAEEANTVAQRLMSQGNIPANVIREAAKGGLDGLGQLEEVWKSAAESGIPVNEGFWGDVYSIAKEDADSSGKPLVPAMEGVVKTAAAQPPEPAKRSLGDVWFNRDAMDRAAARLGETEVVEGYSAADLLALGEDTPMPTGGSVNWSALSDKKAAVDAEQAALREQKDREEKLEEREYQEGKSSRRSPSTSDIDTFNKAFTESVKARTTLPADGGYKAGTPEYESQYRRAEEEALKDMLEKGYSEKALLAIPKYKEIYDRATQEAPPSSPQENTPTTNRPEGYMEKVNIPGKGVSTFSHINRAGKPVYRTPEGSLIAASPEAVTSPNKPAPEATTQGQNTQARLSKALQSFSQGQESEGFFIGVGEQAPQALPSPEGGVLVLKQDIPEGYVYGVEGDESQDILIPKQ